MDARDPLAACATALQAAPCGCRAPRGGHCACRVVPARRRRGSRGVQRIAATLGSDRSAVADYLWRFRESGLPWPPKPASFPRDPRASPSARCPTGPRCTRSTGSPASPAKSRSSSARWARATTSTSRPPDAGVPGGEAVIVDQVAPDHRGVAAAGHGTLDRLPAGHTGAGGRGALGARLPDRRAGLRRRGGRPRVGGHPYGRFCRRVAPAPRRPHGEPGGLEEPVGAPRLAGRVPDLYDLLTLVDALRVGRARERSRAAALLRAKLVPAS